MADTGKVLLRLLFQARTDVQMAPDSDHWKQYAEWLEELAVNELNEAIVERNHLLTDMVYRTIEMLEEGLSQV